MFLSTSKTLLIQTSLTKLHIIIIPKLSLPLQFQKPSNKLFISITRNFIAVKFRQLKFLKCNKNSTSRTIKKASFAIVPDFLAKHATIYPKDDKVAVMRKKVPHCAFHGRVKFFQITIAMLTLSEDINCPMQLLSFANSFTTRI